VIFAKGAPPEPGPPHRLTPPSVASPVTISGAVIDATAYEPID
jgi:hypothetical protein